MSDKIEETLEHKHGHDHSDGHSHEHGHGHSHEHVHGHSHTHSHGGNMVMMGSADGHLLGTMIAYTPASLPVAEMNMELSMKDAVVFIKENGGMPLQVKASLKDAHSTVILNLVGTEIFRAENAESTETDPTKVKCKLLVVADEIDCQTLKDSLETYMGYFVDNSF